MTDDDSGLFEPAHTEMGRHARSGILNSGFVQIVKVAAQFASVVILSRLLDPDDFGLVAMTGPIIAFVQMFMDLGLNQAIIQKQALSRREVSAFFWITVLLGCGLALFVVAASPLAGYYYGDDRVVALTVAMAVTIVIGALGGQHAAILTRRMEFRTLAFVDLASTLASVAVPIAIALVVPTYWALFYGQLASTVVAVGAVWIACRWRPHALRFRDFRSVSDSVRFGLGITSFNVTNFFARNLDNILIGRSFGSVDLGYYDRAYKFLLFPLQRVVYPVNSILVPILSRLQEKTDEYRTFYLKTVNMLVLLTWPGIVWALVSAHEIFTVLLGPEWARSADVFRLLALAAFFQMTNSPTGALFISQGRSRDYATWGLVSSVTSVLLFFLGIPYGITGMAAFYAAGEILRTPFLWYFVGRKGPVGTSVLFMAIAPHLMSMLVSGLAIYGAHEVLSQASFFSLIVTGMLAYVVYGVVMLVFPSGRVLLRMTVEMAVGLVPAGLRQKLKVRQS